MSRRTVLLGGVASLGAALVACNDKAQPKPDGGTDGATPGADAGGDASQSQPLDGANGNDAANIHDAAGTQDAKPSSFVPMKLYDFDGLTNGQSIVSLVSFWGTYTNGYGAKGDTSRAYGSSTSSCNLSIQAGNDGGTGGGTGPNGSFGFGVNFGGTTTVAEGEELWANVRMFVPTGFSFATSTGFLKFMRFENNATGQKMENFILNGGYDGSAATSAPIGWNLGDENFPNVQADTCKPTQGIIPFGSWCSVECYIKASATAASSVRRLWLDGVLQVEITAGKNTKWRTPAGSYMTGTLTNAEPTLPVAGSHLTDMMYFTYWNGNAPQNQSLNVQTIAFHKNAATLPATDAFGNKLIGNVVL